jgi:hypothetical protein
MSCFDRVTIELQWTIPYIQWVGSVLCNSKIKLQGQLQNTFISHNQPQHKKQVVIGFLQKVKVCFKLRFRGESITCFMAP